MISLSSPLTALPGIGPAINKKLKKLGLNKVEDLLHHFPTRYEDYSEIVPIAKLKVGEQVTVKGKMQLISSRRAFRRRLIITEALISDGTGTVKAVWFNQPYLGKSLKPGMSIMLAGKLMASNYGLQLEHPTYEPADQNIHTGRLVPIYPLTAELGQHALRKIIARILPLAKNLPDWLPIELSKKTNLPDLNEAVTCLHFPRSRSELIQARKRIVFNELFLTHLKTKLARLTHNKQTAPIINFAPTTKEFVNALPWKLTNDQKIAAWEIIQDLEKKEPMFRLLQGDVGSGKTIVAGLAAFNVARSGLQTVFLAPTEILAEQHFHTLINLFKNWPINLGLLTRGHQTTSQHKVISSNIIKKEISGGRVNIIIGTHALLQQSVKFKKLGLVIIDEQHRFGVEQRQNLIKNNEQLTPHLLSLSATPIPRSLALTIYGELSLSALKSLPAGRKPITTTIIAPHKRSAAYTIMRNEVAAGHRVFIICPLIEESDTLGVRAATTEYERLGKEIFPDIKLGLLHGKMTSEVKNHAMEQFKNGTTPILVSTSVVEVGVDVPEATVVAIEGAERFGIAQLHQFRGRVGRSNMASYCLLLSDNNSPLSAKRLQALVKYQNGFDLSEFDLKQRGPGDLLGDIQSGWTKLKFAELADRELLNLVRQTVTNATTIDPTLQKWPKLKEMLGSFEFHPE